MGRNLDRVIADIPGIFQDEARESLVEQEAVRSGRLLDSVEVNLVGLDDYRVEFLEYGVYVDEGTSTHTLIGPRPFYSNLILEGPEEGTAEAELTQRLEEAFEQDIEEMDDELNRMIND